MKHIFLDEFRAHLHDDSINLMGLSEPKELNYVNFAKGSTDWPFPEQPLSIEIFLSKKVLMQKRIVLDIFMMFGEVGGLYDFLALILRSFLEFFSERLLLASLVGKLFYRAPNTSS